MKAKDFCIVLALGIGSGAMIAFLFYDSTVGLVWMIPAIVVAFILYVYYIGQKQKEQIKKEFREILLSLANGLAVGQSVENAFGEAEKNIQMLFGSNGILRKDLFYLNQKVRMGVAVERQFAHLAETYNIEEMKTFSDLFLYAKRMGGNYTANIRKLALRMDEKIGIREDMEGQMAEKMLELRIMAAVPLGILAYLKVSAAEFLAPMYETVGGRIAMTGCIFLYIISILLGIVIVRKTLEV